MDTKIKCSWFFIILSIVFSCKKVNGTTGRAKIIIAGKITSGLKPMDDSLSVVYFKDNRIFGNERYSSAINKAGEFKIIIWPENPISEVSIRIKGGEFIFLNLVEAGDSILLDVDASSRFRYKITGNNIAKYLCKDSLDKHLNVFQRITLDKNRANYQLARKQIEYGYIYSIFEREAKSLIEILNLYKGSLTSEMYNYLRGQYLSFCWGTWDSVMTEQLTSNHEKENLTKLKKQYFKYKFSDSNLVVRLALFNEYYLKAILRQAANDLLVSTDYKKFTYTEYYDFVKKRYSGILRERLLTIFLFDFKTSINVVNYSSFEYSNCVEDALETVVDPYLKSLLSSKLKLKNGTKFFSFSLPDISGRMVKLDDLKGKIFILDVWATGCTGCSYFYKMFDRLVYPKIKDIKDFEMVSVSVDNSKERWISGIKSNNYTNPQHLNLFTEGLAMNHPLMKHYSLDTIPFIVLIDRDGEIISKIDISLSAEEVLHLITSALRVSKGF